MAVPLALLLQPHPVMPLATGMVVECPKPISSDQRSTDYDGKVGPVPETKSVRRARWILGEICEHLAQTDDSTELILIQSELTDFGMRLIMNIQGGRLMTNATEPIANVARYNGSLALGTAPRKGERLSQNPYEPVYEWGRDGYDLGSPPEYTFFVSEGPDGYGLGFNIEGDWREETYADRGSRDAAIDAAAFEVWKRNEEEQVENIESVDDMPADLRGPYSDERLEREAGPEL